MKAVRENRSVVRHGNNYLDKDFRVGDRVELVAKGVEIYGHYPEMVLGRKGVISRIPLERWESNCVQVKWDDEERHSVLGCWAVHWVEEEAAQSGQAQEKGE